MLRFARTHPFLLVGIVTLAILAAAPRHPVLAPVTRVIIIPAWLGWTSTTIVTQWIVDLPTERSLGFRGFAAAMLVLGGLLPYLLADGVLWLFRRTFRGGGATAAT